MTLKFIFQYPELNGPDGDLCDSGAPPEVAAACERAGFSGIAFTEHPAPGANWLSAGGHQTLDPFVALGACAAATTTIKLLTYLAVVPYRNPFLLAKAAATVDKLSNGRFVLGVGTGYLKAEFFALGVDFEERNELFDEALDVLGLHWAGEPFSYEGRHFNARNVIARPRPVQIPIPIWIGGNAKVTRDRVAEKAQGWMPLQGSVELATTTRTPSLGGLDDIATRIAQIRDQAKALGRTDEIDVVLSTSRSANGTGADVARNKEAYAHLADMGATYAIVSSPPAAPQQTIDWIESFGATYLS